MIAANFKNFNFNNNRVNIHLWNLRIVFFFFFIFKQIEDCVSGLHITFDNSPPECLDEAI